MPRCWEISEGFQDGPRLGKVEVRDILGRKKRMGKGSKNNLRAAFSDHLPVMGE